MLMLTTAAASVTDLQQLDDRAATIGYRLAVANAALCPDATRLAGFAVHDLTQYDSSYRATAVQNYGLDDRPAVLTLVPASAANKAGLKVGDKIAAISGVALRRTPLPTGKPQFERVAEIDNRIAATLARGVLDLGIERGGKSLTIHITGERGCPSRVQIVPGKKRDASANGVYVQLTAGMAMFAADDDGLALVIAHEMAHNIWHHRARLKAEGRTTAHIRATEEDADYAALYLMARAGYAIDGAPGFWARDGKANGFGIFADGTHPSTKQRVALATATIAEIRAKQAAGQPLVPRNRPAQ
jgi:beta-barrel assembly-enhancing protease